MSKPMDDGQIVTEWKDRADDARDRAERARSPERRARLRAIAEIYNRCSWELETRHAWPLREK